MEPHPPRVPEPYIVARTKGGNYELIRISERDGSYQTILKCLSKSEDGAHRESMIFLKDLVF
jgi:hypothetical protein